MSNSNRISFIFMEEWFSIVYYLFGCLSMKGKLIFSLIYGHLDCSSFLDIMNCATRHVGEQAMNQHSGFISFVYVQ